MVSVPHFMDKHRIEVVANGDYKLPPTLEVLNSVRRLCQLLPCIHTAYIQTHHLYGFVYPICHKTDRTAKFSKVTPLQVEPQLPRISVPAIHLL